MRIAAVETTLVDLPLPRPVGTAIHAISSAGCVVVEVVTGDGLRGSGYLFAIDAARLGAFDEMVRGLAHLVVGRDPHDTAAIWADIERELNPTGLAGVGVIAASTLDVACWDMVGHAAGLPLHKLWGAARDTVPTYASSGLWLSATLDELQAEAAAFVQQGFGAIKLRIGNPDPRTDVARAAAVREAIGDSVELYVDANQGLDTKVAIRLGRQLEELGVTWFEEPVGFDDLAGHARVRDALDLDVATGETVYTARGIADIVAARAADVVMPDLQRVGGYTEMRRAAAIASAHNVAVSTHFFTELSLCVAGALPGCRSVEHVDWFADLFVETPELRDGELVVPDRPGHGFTLDRDALAHHGVG